MSIDSLHIIDILVASLSGCALAVAVARYAILKALHDLEELSHKIINISEMLAGVSVRLEMLNEHDTVIKEHAKKIAFFEGILKHDYRTPRSLS